MHLFTLGRLKLDGVAFSRPKPLLLLAYLSVEGPKDRRFLAELFWPAAARPMASLRVALAHLRSGAPGAVNDDGRVLRSAVHSDAAVLLRSLEDGDLPAALRLYDGPFLAGIDLQSVQGELAEWLLTTREQIADRVRDALLRKAGKEAQAGDFAAAAACAEHAWRLAGASYPAIETLIKLHLLFSAAGSTLASTVQAEALAFGVTLDPDLAAARRELSGERQSIAPGLPVRASSFVGRDRELLWLTRLLARHDTRLVTVCGPGGVGKTRLALQCAYGEYGDGLWPDGLLFVELEHLTEAGRIPTAIAEGLGVQLSGRSGALTELAAAIGQRRMLLILDNFEQLSGGSNTPSQLLRACPGLTLLITSRARLNLDGEHVLVLQGLPIPVTPDSAIAAQYDGVQLFLDRALQAQPAFELDSATLPHVLSICGHVAGSPLGIELAAAWIRTLPVEEIAAELRHSLELLAGGANDLPERQRSMRSTLEHSWRLLSTEEQEVLSRLSVFVGGFSRQAAAAVCGATLQQVSSLADKSLLQLTASGRFGQHPVVRQFAHEKLLLDPAAYAATEASHGHHYLQLATVARGELQGARQEEALQRIDLDLDNARAALAAALRQRHTALALGLAGALGPYWQLRGHLSEGRGWLAKALALPVVASDITARANALGAAGRLAFAQGDMAASRAFLEEALALQRPSFDRPGLAAALHNLGNALASQNELEAAETHLEESLVIRNETGDQRGEASTLHSLGNVARRRGSLTLAFERYSRCLEIVTGLGDRHGEAQALNGVGCVKLEEGDLHAAREFLERSLHTHRHLGNPLGSAIALTNLGETAKRTGNLEQARAHLEESLALREQVRDIPGAARMRAALLELED